MNVYVTPALMRAIFDAGYRLGVTAGSETSAAYDWGNGYHPEPSEEAWEDSVPFELLRDKEEITSPEFWKDIV